MLIFFPSLTAGTHFRGCKVVKSEEFGKAVYTPTWLYTYTKQRVLHLGQFCQTISAGDWEIENLHFSVEFLFPTTIRKFLFFFFFCFHHYPFLKDSISITIISWGIKWYFLMTCILIKVLLYWDNCNFWCSLFQNNDKNE